MEWTAWIIPVLVVAGWILKQLSANKEEEARKQERAQARRPASFDKPQDQPAKKQPEEVRKFLEDLRRQRGGKPNREAVSQFIPEGEPTAQVVRPRPAPRPAAPPPLPARKSNRADFIPVQVVSIPPPAPSLSQSAQMSQSVQMSQVATRIVKPTPPAVKQFLELIKNPQNMGAAFLLREVLDGPIARRPRRVPGVSGLGKRV